MTDMTRIRFRDIDIDVIRKRIKHINIRIKPGSVSLALPLTVDINTGLAFVSEKYDWIIRTISKVNDRQSLSVTPPDQKQLRDFVKLARDRVEYWCSIMQCGTVHLRFRLMKSRWGSCRPDTRSVCLNLYLYAYNTECLDYVIIHELTHMYRGPHDTIFWKRVENYCPDWRKLRSTLRNVPDKH